MIQSCHRPLSTVEVLYGDLYPNCNSFTTSTYILNRIISIRLPILIETVILKSYFQFKMNKKTTAVDYLTHAIQKLCTDLNTMMSKSVYPISLDLDLNSPLRINVKY